MSAPRPAAERPCAACPWRTSNQGRRHPGGWYTKANLRRLWVGLRRGESMSCHPTDPGNLVTDEMVAKGVKRAKANAIVRECAGALLLQQREVHRFGEIAGANPRPRDAMKAYRVAHPKGLTREGLAAIVSRSLLGGTPLAAEMTAMNLNTPDVGHPDLTPWEGA